MAERPKRPHDESSDDSDDSDDERDERQAESTKRLRTLIEAPATTEDEAAEALELAMHVRSEAARSIGVVLREYALSHWSAPQIMRLASLSQWRNEFSAWELWWRLLERDYAGARSDAELARHVASLPRSTNETAHDSEHYFQLPANHPKLVYEYLYRCEQAAVRGRGGPLQPVLRAPECRTRIRALPGRAATTFAYGGADDAVWVHEIVEDAPGVARLVAVARLERGDWRALASQGAEHRPHIECIDVCASAIVAGYADGAVYAWRFERETAFAAEIATRPNGTLRCHAAELVAQMRVGVLAVAFVGRDDDVLVAENQHIPHRGEPLELARLRRNGETALWERTHTIEFSDRILALGVLSQGADAAVAPFAAVTRTAHTDLGELMHIHVLSPRLERLSAPTVLAPSSFSVSLRSLVALRDGEFQALICTSTELGTLASCRAVRARRAFDGAIAVREQTISVDTRNAVLVVGSGDVLRYAPSGEPRDVYLMRHALDSEQFFHAPILASTVRVTDACALPDGRILYAKMNSGSLVTLCGAHRAETSRLASAVSYSNDTSVLSFADDDTMVYFGAENGKMQVMRRFGEAWLDSDLCAATRHPVVQREAIWRLEKLYQLGEFVRYSATSYALSARRSASVILDMRGAPPRVEFMCAGTTPLIADFGGAAKHTVRIVSSSSTLDIANLLVASSEHLRGTHVPISVPISGNRACIAMLGQGASYHAWLFIVDADVATGALTLSASLLLNDEPARLMTNSVPVFVGPNSMMVDGYRRGSDANASLANLEKAHRDMDAARNAYNQKKLTEGSLHESAELRRARDQYFLVQKRFRAASERHRLAGDAGASGAFCVHLHAGKVAHVDEITDSRFIGGSSTRSFFTGQLTIVSSMREKSQIVRVTQETRSALTLDGGTAPGPCAWHLSEHYDTKLYDVAHLGPRLATTMSARDVDLALAASRNPVHFVVDALGNKVVPDNLLEASDPDPDFDAMPSVDGVRLYVKSTFVPVGAHRGPHGEPLLLSSELSLPSKCSRCATSCSKLECAACAAPYCSRECQSSDWATHSGACARSASQK